MMKMRALNQIGMTTVLMGLSSFIFAAENNAPKQNNVSQEKKGKPAPTYSPYLGDMMPPYTNPNRFLAEASFIYWQADVDGLDYGLEQNFQLESGSSVQGAGPNTYKVTNVTYTDNMKNKDLDFKWDPGFKLGIGVVFGEMDEWDLVLNWTWLKSKAKRTRKIEVPATFGQIQPVDPLNPTITPVNTSGDFLTPTYSDDFLGSPAVNAFTNWRMLYNTLDLELGRNFFMAKNMTMRTHVGLRGAWIHQATKIDYVLGSKNSSFNPFNSLTNTSVVAPEGLPNYVPGNLIGTSQFKGKNSYNAVGLRGGLDMRWNFTDHFCVYSSLAGAILYGQFKIDEDFDADYTITLLPANGNAGAITNTVGSAGLDNSYHRTRTNLQAILGLLWHTSLYNDRHHFTISGGYEVNEWFQQNELRSVDGDTVPFTLKSNRTNGDLGLHGLTIDMKYDF